MSSAISHLRVTRRKLRNGTIRYRYILGDLPDAPYCDQTRNQQSRAELESHLRNAAETLGQAQDAGPRVAGELTFADLGDMLGRDYLPPQVVTYLFGSTDPLFIETDDPEFPWDIVRFQGQTLAAYRPIGRTVPRLRTIPVGIQHWGQQRRALLIGDSLSNSPNAAREVDELTVALERYHDRYETTPLLGGDATKHAISSALQHGVEFLHVAGHVTYNKAERNKSAITCASAMPSGELFTADEIRSLKGIYAFVFLDGCNGGRAAQNSGIRADDPARAGIDEIAEYLLSAGGRDVEGLAIPFLEGGASIFISTLWRVRDAAAYAFAHAFYQQALQGMAIGEALRRVKDSWLHDRPGDPSWAAYVLYGNPLHTLDTVRDPNQLDQPTTHTAGHFMMPSIPSLGSRAAGVFRNPRTEQFFRRFEPDPEITLSENARQILEGTLSWVDKTGWRMITRLDLFVGMARVPGGMVERGLTALGSSTQALCELNIEIFGTSNQRAEQPYVSPGVYTTLMRAVDKCAKRDATMVSEDDMVAALLDLPPSGSLQDVFQILRLDDGKTLLAAARDEIAADNLPQRRAPRLSSARLLRTPRGNAKLDATPRNLLRDLRAEINNAHRLGVIPPFVGRETELFEVLRTLASADDVPHVVIHGAPGAGSRSLAYHLAVRLVLQPDASDTAAIAHWDLAALRLTRESSKVSEWLPDEVSQLRNPTIILLEDLPTLLSFDGVAETIQQMQQHPNLRLLVTAHTDEYRRVRREFHAIADALTPTLLEPPRDEEALHMVASHLPQLQGHYQVRIAPEAQRVAVEMWRAESPLVLPGAALIRLERACARKVNQFDGGDTSWDGLGEMSAPPQAIGHGGALETRPSNATPTVTEQDVRAANA
jgi:CHAT domain